jgi:hypothetical protein
MADASVAMAGPGGQPDHSGNGRRRVRFDPTINLGHVLTAFAFLFSTLAAWFTLNARVDMAAQAIVRLERIVDAKADKEATSRGEIELSRRVVEGQQNQHNALVRIDEGFKELKAMIRDVDRKLDNKVDKPGR